MTLPETNQPIEAAERPAVASYVVLREAAEQSAYTRSASQG